ncbi:hypothetical protein C3432_10800 [Citrobacter amalonaticus]|uniref:cyclic-guanylate-specific phosphodiesterase n=1 Tax=Citrobacter amalonaticus TaxID=35703 RepID=A0A2S4S0E7_CITAM|nr:EAL domain-containing protein [Citrobacter amalonaticus]POT58372.1 hypothetical protein C3432_10800 [Citrobacter amalonaticus]POT76102.1 hypothetical protein C3436_01020 [Citrobacter amalonaticus]POU66899.1 hypothetical protein C3430_09000 [Citrobacter amalonaticus]POV05336.1 hypothetical protein C3424_08325 [Citrobacter amalonaticus]
MTTRHLISLVTGVLILSVLVPVGLSIWLAHRQVEKSFIEELDTYASRVAVRADKVATQGKQALKQAETFQGTPCGSNHLLKMRQVSYSFRYIQEVLYLDNNVPLCSSLEQKSATVPFPEPTTVTDEGYRVWLTTQNDLGFRRSMVAIGSEHYIVMIDPESFLDVIPFSGWRIDSAIVGQMHHAMISSNGHPPTDILPIIERATVRPQQLEFHDVIYNFRSFPEMNITIVSWASTLPLHKSWQRQVLIWLPAGLMFGLLVAAFILRILRRLQSPHHRLQDAIQHRDIKVHYQPIVSLSTGKVVGAEALARWPQSDGSDLSPDIFITLAQQTGLTEPLTRLIIENVFEDMGKWLHQHPELHISINLEASDLMSERLPELLSQLLNRYQIAPSQIALELTERGFADPKTSAPIITRYRNAGHSIFIDDFGTGYSSLSYLQNLDVNILKIDKSFVDALEYKNVTPHIIELAKTLKLEMVAEGIETENQADWLRRHGVQYGQGWLYSKALPKAEFILWAEKRL